MDETCRTRPRSGEVYDHARTGAWDGRYTRYAGKQHDGWSATWASRFANAVAPAVDKPKGLYLYLPLHVVLVVEAVTATAGPYLMIRHHNGSHPATRQNRGPSPTRMGPLELQPG